MPKIYDVIAATGEYTDREGNKKTSWLKCGAIFEKDGKKSLKMDAHAVGEGWYVLSEPKPKEQKGSGEKQAQRSSHAAPEPEPLDDDIPF